jgi:hypothetical protein
VGKNEEGALSVMAESKSAAQVLFKKLTLVFI